MKRKTNKKHKSHGLLPWLLWVIIGFYDLDRHIGL